jgi:hypothetical protein
MEPSIDVAGHEPRLVAIIVNNRSVEVPHKTTGAEIKALAGVPADFELFRIEGDQEKPIADKEELTVHPDERFIASPVLQPS